ncbi:MAG: DMT family transporter [Clostridia bacterium]|nr:DMT family transporter [Clostridia bacterium]
MNKRFASNCMLVLTAMIWGFAFVAQKEASDYIGSLTFIAIRFLLGGIALIPVIFIFERSDLKDKAKLLTTVKYGIVTGCFLFTASLLQQVGIAVSTQANKAGFITGLYTVLVPIIGIFMGKKARINIWVGAILAVAGLYMVSVVGAPVVEFGDLLLLIGAFFWAGHILSIDKFIDKVSPIKFSAVQFVTSSILGFVFLPFFELSTFSMANIMSAGVSLLYAGIMSSGVAYTLQIIGQKNSGPTESAIIFSLESVFCAVGCMLLLGETMSLTAVFGCVLIFAGIVISQLEFKTKK